MDSPRETRPTRFTISEDTNMAQATLESLRKVLLDGGTPLPELRVDWLSEEPRIVLGSVSLAEAHTLCRRLSETYVPPRVRKFAPNEEIWDSGRGVFARVISCHGGTLRIQDRDGRSRDVPAGRCAPAHAAAVHAAPSGTVPTTVDGDSVQEGDYIWVAGAYRRVEAKRPGTSLGGRVLTLTDHGLWVITGPRTAHRPVVPVS